MSQGFKNQGNTATIDITVKRKPKDLDHVLEDFEIDLDTWTVDNYVVNTWEVGMKGPDGSPVVVPLFQVKIWLRRKVAILTDLPVLHPIEIKVEKKQRKTYKPKMWEKALIIPDSQNGYMRDVFSGELKPFHDRLAWDAAIHLAEDIQPDRVVLLGDMLDLPTWSDKFTKKPEFYWTTQPALIELGWYIGRLRQVCPAHTKIDWMEGNHEFRMRNMIMHHMAEAFQLRSIDQLNSTSALSVPNLMCLDKLGVDYHDDYPNSDIWLGPKIRIIHGHTHGKGALHNMVKDELNYLIVGHLHRVEMIHKTLWPRDGHPQPIGVVAGGCLVDLKGDLPRVVPKSDWQNAVLEIDYPTSKECKAAPVITPILINKGLAYRNKKMYQGHFSKKDLVKATGWKYF